MAWLPSSFPKPAKTYAEQIDILRSRGLLVNDPCWAEQCLRHHNYYRLSAYRFPLTIHGAPDQFIHGSTFEQLWALYEFDRRIRHLVLEASKRVEISVRSRWAYEVGHAHGPQSFEDAALFRNRDHHARSLQKLDEELARSKEDFVAHFRDIYGMKRPPIWAACEVMSFGQISSFYGQLVSARLRQVIADTYGLDERVLVSFLHHLNLVRNICAHHGRLWNRRFTISVQIPRTKPDSIIGSFDSPPVNHPQARRAQGWE